MSKKQPATQLTAPRRAEADSPLSILVGAFVGCLVISQVLAVKLAGAHLPGLGEIVFPAGVVAYAATYLCTDVISECYGKAASNRAVVAGLAANLVMLGMIQIALLFPAASFWQKGEAFSSVVGASSRVTIASLAAYLVSQFHDVWLFHWLRDRTRNRHLWLRNNVATMLSQTLDTSIFITIAFYGQAPVGRLIIGQLLVKWAVALLDTPFVYLLVALVGSRGRGR